MLNGDSNSKKQLCTCGALFFVHFFAVVLRDHNVKRPNLYTFNRGNVV